MGPVAKIQVDQMTKIAEANGWSVVAVDVRTPFMTLIIQKPKPEAEKVYT